MKKQSISKEVEIKKSELAAKLLSLKDSWPYSEKAAWCVKNGYNTDSITRGYFKGAIGSIPVAETIIEVIELYLKETTVAA